VTFVAKGQRIRTYKQFWHHYLRQHAKRGTRLSHYAGTALAIGAAVVFGATTHWAWLLAMPVVAYGFAWFSHAVIEQNAPATFTYPLWSLVSDFRMFLLAITGKLGPHLQIANNRETKPFE
jgi:hypothetical protein